MEYSSSSFLGVQFPFSVGIQTASEARKAGAFVKATY